MLVEDQSSSYSEIVYGNSTSLLRIFWTQKKTKTNTNPNPDPNRYRRHCPDLMLGYISNISLEKIASRILNTT